MRARALTWMGDNVLNALAYCALRVAPPIRANICVRRVARLYPMIENIEEARAMVKRLGSRGTCLSRSLAVASRCVGSEVVIGALGPGSGTATTSPPQRPLQAHAWVEVGGTPLLSDETSWRELGRLSPRSGLNPMDPIDSSAPDRGRGGRDP
jgi:hypothetical protein